MTVFLVGMVYLPCGDSSEIYVIVGGCSIASFGGLAGWRKRMARFFGPGMLPSTRMYEFLTLP